LAPVQAARASYDPRLYADLVAVEEKHFWFRARNRAITAVFSSIAKKLTPGYRVLEVGCGTGNVLRAVQKVAVGGTVVGMDLHEEGLRYARQRLGAAMLVRADAAHPPFSVGFDVVGLFDVLEHLDEDVSVLRSLRELLGPGGALLLTVPANPSLWSYFDVAAHHRRRYEEKDLRAKLLAAELSVEYLTPYMTVLHPVLWAGRRFAAGRSGGSADPAEAWNVAKSDLKIRPISGALLGFLLDQEVRFLQRRQRLPIGASLLAVARRA
jgi:SAM-dependent methyltransferase